MIKWYIFSGAVCTPSIQSHTVLHLAHCKSFWQWHFWNRSWSFEVMSCAAKPFHLVCKFMLAICSAFKGKFDHSSAFMRCVFSVLSPLRLLYIFVWCSGGISHWICLIECRHSQKSSELHFANFSNRNSCLFWNICWNIQAKHYSGWIE